jgi:hypothetical protein
MPSKSTRPRIIFWWARPSGLGQPKSSHKGIGVNTPIGAGKEEQTPPRLGPGGYEAKQAVFRKLDEAAETSGDPKKMKVKELKKRLKQWIYARSVDSSDLNFVEDIEEAVSRILKCVEDSENGVFTPSRERDELSVGLGNPEHTGRTRGLGKLVT